MSNYYKITFVTTCGTESEAFIVAATEQEAINDLSDIYEGWTVKCVEIDLFKVEHVNVSTPELTNGDVIRHFNAVFKLKNKKVWEDGCVTFDTDLLAFKEDGPMPKGWAENNYRIQGNEKATWAMIKPE